MDIVSDSALRVSRMEIVDSGRRRRFSDEAKLAIVLESNCAPRQVAATAHRHGITRFQLNNWRRAAREGRLGGSPADAFVPALVVADYDIPVVPAKTAPEHSGRMEVVSANGRRIVVDGEVDVDALLRIVRGLETL